MNFEKFKNAENNVVDVAEAGRLGLLGVVQAAGPVDGDVSVGAVEADGGADGAASGGATEVEETVEDRAILPHVEALELAVVGVGVLGQDLRRNGGQELDIVIGMEAADVLLRRGKGAVDLHSAVETVVYDEVVGHANAVRLHWVSLAVVVVADAGFVEIRHSPLLGVGTHRRQRRATLRLFSLSSRHLSLSASINKTLPLFSLSYYNVLTQIYRLRTISSFYLSKSKSKILSLILCFYKSTSLSSRFTPFDSSYYIALETKIFYISCYCQN